MAAPFESAAPASPSASLPRWRRFLPFFLAAVLIAFVVARLDAASFSRQLATTNYWGLLSFAAVMTLVLIATDSMATVGIYRRTIGPIPFGQFFVVRAASCLPALINYHLGQAWVTYFISKVYRAPLWRVAGATLLTYATTMGCLLLFGIAALPFNMERIPWLGALVGSVTVAAGLYLVVIAIKPRFLRSWGTTAPLVEAGVRGHLAALAYRVPHMTALFVATWVPFRFFGVSIPLTHALATIPPVMFVAALPVTPQGLGTRDLLAVQLFSHYATGTDDERQAAVVATTLTWVCALTLVQLATSPFFLRRAREYLGEMR